MRIGLEANFDENDKRGQLVSPATHLTTRPTCNTWIHEMPTAVPPGVIRETKPIPWGGDHSPGVMSHDRSRPQAPAPARRATRDSCSCMRMDPTFLLRYLHKDRQGCTDPPAITGSHRTQAGTRFSAATSLLRVCPTRRVLSEQTYGPLQLRWTQPHRTPRHICRGCASTTAAAASAPERPRLPI